MKKASLILLLICKSALFSQTILNSYPLELNDPLENGQALNVEDVKTHDIYLFTADNKNINILKYNKSLFLTNQFSDSIKYVENRTLVGHSISEDGSPTLYWGSNDLRNLRIIKYYLGTKTAKALNFDFSPEMEYVITTFQKDNSFYILAKEKNFQHLLLYEFENGKCEIKMFDLSTFQFQNEKGQTFAFSSIIKYLPIQKMEVNEFNSLDKTVYLNKMYVLKDRIILTFDYNKKRTQILDLNLETGSITSKSFNQPVSKGESTSSNSFYNENKLYQISVNKDELLFDIKDFDSERTLKSVSISKNDTISFKNSSLLLQTNNDKPQNLKTTAKFLKQVSGLLAGITVLKNKNNTVVTLGGFAERLYTEQFFNQEDIYGFGAGNNQSQYSLRKMAFFDTMLNSDSEFVKNGQQEPLAIDNIFYFLSINKNIALENILKLKDYSILSYYDMASKQLIIRKFTDGFIREDIGNPIMNKSQFSKPATFKKLKFIEN
jgi:hypothetical protein